MRLIADCQLLWLSVKSLNTQREGATVNTFSIVQTLARTLPSLFIEIACTAH